MCAMKNITLALDDDTLKASRVYAQRHGTTLNALVRELLVKTVVVDRDAAVREMFRLMGPPRTRGSQALDPRGASEDLNLGLAGDS